jgi:hypothetical protein
MSELWFGENVWFALRQTMMLFKSTIETWISTDMVPHEHRCD